MASVIGIILLVLTCICYQLRINWKGFGLLFVVNNSLILYITSSTYLALVNLVLCTSLLLLSDRQPKKWMHPKKKFYAFVYLIVSLSLLTFWATHLQFTKTLEQSAITKLNDVTMFNNLVENYQDLGLVVLVVFIFLFSRMNFMEDKKC
jgi:hypothetical protein